MAKFNTEEQPLRYGKIRSMQKHPVQLSYEGEALIVPPQGTIENVDKELLGHLPVGIKFVSYPVKS
jgi:hypothetical protein